MMMLLLRRPSAAEAVEPGRQAAEAPRPERRPEKAVGRSFAECLRGKTRGDEPERREVSRPDAASSEAKPRRRDEKEAAGLRKVEEAPVSAGAAAAESQPVAEESPKVEAAPMWAKAVKERLVEGIVRLLVEAWAERRRGAKTEQSSDIPGMVEGLKEELRRFDTEALSELLGRLRASGNPWETLKDWMAGRVPERRPEPFVAEAVKRSSDKAEAVRPSEAFVLTEDGKVAVNREKVEVVDRRERPEAKAWSGRQEKAEAARAGAERPAAAAPQAQERKAEAVKESVSGPKVWLREAEGREARNAEVRQAAEARPAAALERTNRIFAELARQARLMLEDRRSVLEVELRPPHLGKVTVKLEVSPERLTARLMAQNDGTGEMLRQNMGDLYQAFRDAGFDLSRLDVQVGSGAEGRGEGFGEWAAAGGSVGAAAAAEAEGTESFVFTADMLAEAARLDAWA